jgi:hypothetical protein
METNRVPTKEDFDWLLYEMTGFMRTQILAVAASLRLAEHLQNGGRIAEDFAAVSGIDRSNGISPSAGMHEDRSDCLRRWLYVQVHLASAGPAWGDTRLA